MHSNERQSLEGMAPEAAEVSGRAPRLAQVSADAPTAGATHGMSLVRLLSEGRVPGADAAPGVGVTGVTCDSREVVRGSLFVGLPGEREDGARHARDACRRGAAAVITERVLEEGLEVPHFTVPDARRALARLAAVFHGWPSRSLDVAGITGTNGKSTTAALLRAALEGAGRPCGLLGTLGYDTGAARHPAPNTTPGAHRLQALLAEMRDAGRGACAMEVSSHALVQGRVDAVAFRCGVFTNLTRDHLDYHGTLEEYLDAKADLFRRLPPDGVAVLNHDDPAWELLARETQAKLVTFGVETGGDYRARILRLDETGVQAEVHTPMGPLFLRSPLVGRHNLSNLLAALGAAVALGSGPEEALRGLAAMDHIPGRMQPVPVPAAFSVLVDYAHTPDALEQVLRNLRPMVAGRLWVLFGCGGDRDAGKRPLMARAAERWADAVMVTSDNPRSENPMSIIRDVMRGFGYPRNALLEPDRAEAIRIVLRLAQPGDVVLLAGKGHEGWQIVGDEVQPFHDADEVTRFFGGR